MDFSDYINGELYIIVPVLYIIGVAIKKSALNDKWIPLILGGLGIILVTVYELTVHFPMNISEVLQLTFVSVTQGILCAAGSVYANNVIKQLKK